MESKTLSVVIPLYNVGNYLDKCIYSVVNQSYRNLEIVLVNDASTDDTGKRCELWEKKDERICVIHKKKNEGRGEARNTGVKRCTGEYLTFLDADDWWEGTFAEKMITVLEENAADIVISDIYYENADTTELSQIRMEQDTVYCPKQKPEVINLSRTFLWGKVYNIHFYQRLKVRQSKRAYEDLALVPYIVAKADRIARCKSPLYHYLRHREGNTVDDLSQIGAIKDALEKVTELFKYDGIFEDFKFQLERLCFGQVRFAVRKIGGLYEQYQKNILDLYSFMDREFPGWFNPEGKCFLLCGGKEQADALSLILYREKGIDLCSMGQVDHIDDKMYDYILKNIPERIEGWSEKWNLADRLYQTLREYPKN